jgi:hypothetical protein
MQQIFMLVSDPFPSSRDPVFTAASRVRKSSNSGTLAKHFPTSRLVRSRSYYESVVYCGRSGGKATRVSSLC